MNNWNYEALGFRSEKEMNESIARVKEQMKNPKNDLEIRDYNRQKTNELITSTGGIDFKGLEEGARLAELDKVVANKLHWEKQQAEIKAEQEEVNKLMSSLADKLKEDNRVKAERELQEAEAKRKEELQKEIYNKHNVKTDKQKEQDELYRDMLKGLKI